MKNLLLMAQTKNRKREMPQKMMNTIQSFNILAPSTNYIFLFKFLNFKMCLVDIPTLRVFIYIFFIFIYLSKSAQYFLTNVPLL